MKKVIYFTAICFIIIISSCNSGALTPEQQEKKTIDSQNKADKQMEDSLLKLMNEDTTQKK